MGEGKEMAIGTVSRGYFELSYNFERCSMCPYNRE